MLIQFSVGFGVAAFSLAAWYTNKDTETWVSKLSGRFGLRTITDRDIWVAKRQELAKEANATLQTLPTALSFLPDIMLVPVLRSYVFLKEMRLNSSPSVAAQVDIIATCAGVFVLWKLRSFTPFLSKWFLHNPIAWTRRQDWRNSFTMLTSTVRFTSRAVLTEVLALLPAPLGIQLDRALLVWLGGVHVHDAAAE